MTGETSLMDNTPTRSGYNWDDFEDAIQRFEEDWRGGARPELVAYLPTAAGDTRLLTELVHTDLEYRLCAGEAARIEEYLARYPELAKNRDALLELIAAEHEFRRRREPDLAPGEFFQRFPQYRTELLGKIGETLISSQARGVPIRSTNQASEAVPEIAGYKVLGLLGRGGMGVVYGARQLGLDRTVALKMVSTGSPSSPKDLARFRAEAAALARLHHPNIVQIYDVGESEGQPYFVFEFVAGGSLAQYLQGKPQSARPAAQFVNTLARAVHAAHLSGVIHRDLKPANILLWDGRAGTTSEARDPSPLASLVPKITDFGLAKCTGGDGALERRGPTVTGDLLGTPSYMAPEQAMMQRQPIGPSADVYSLGAILYELLTGRPPFTADTPLATILQVLDNDPVSVTSLQPKVPRELEIICLKCLRKDPRARYCSALDLAEELGRFLRDEPIRARPVSAAEKLWRWMRRHPAPTGLLACGLLGPLVALVTISILSVRLVRSNALESAAQQAELLEEATKEYSRTVQRVEKAKFTVNKTVPPTPGTVPLSIPATFLHDVGTQLSLAGRTGVMVRQYSDYPYPWRTNGGPRDDFERTALVRLRQSMGRETVHQFTEMGGMSVVRYAQARIMERSCVECHSAHPQSPRKDWRVGDVRGVLEIIRPLEKDEARIHEALRLALLASAGVSGLLLGGSMLVVWAERRRSRVAV
jgi:serine/threonine protein kinase